MIKFTKAISPLIATILLVVVAVALISIVLTWGKGFTNDSLSETTDITKFKPSDVTSFLDIDKGLNGRFFVKYRPPTSFTQSITITHYSLLGLNRIPLEPNVTIAANTTQALDLGIVDETFDLVLYLDDNTIISRIGVKTENRAPSPTACPTGYVPIPGNFLYDTTNGSNMGFCVAKYEMKVDQNGDGIGDVNTDCNYSSSDFTWHNGTCPYTENNRTIVSSVEGYPLAYISQTQSQTACESLGSNYHLITNEEWMTIVRNLERVNENWTSGEVGTGSLKMGNTGSCTVGSACYAGPDPDYTGAPTTVDGTSDRSETSTAKLKLTNNQYIWDFSGNVWEWVDKNIDVSSVGSLPYYDISSTINPNGLWLYLEFSEGVTNYDINYITDYGSLNYKDFYSLNSVWNTNQGTGRVYTRYDYTSSTVRGFLRGGTWYHGSNAGSLALRLSSGPSHLSSGLGLRCAVVP